MLVNPVRYFDIRNDTEIEQLRLFYKIDNTIKWKETFDEKTIKNCPLKNLLSVSDNRCERTIVLKNQTIRIEKIFDEGAKILNSIFPDKKLQLSRWQYDDGEFPRRFYTQPSKEHMSQFHNTFACEHLKNLENLNRFNFERKQPNGVDFGTDMEFTDEDCDKLDLKYILKNEQEIYPEIIEFPKVINRIVASYAAESDLFSAFDEMMNKKKDS